MNLLPDKNHDKLKGLITPGYLEQPPSHFTSDLMKKLGVELVPAPVRYEPVISITGWVVIGISVLTILVITLLNPTSGYYNAFSSMDITSKFPVTHVLQEMLSSPFTLYLALISVAAFVLIYAESIYRKSKFRMVQA